MHDLFKKPQSLRGPIQREARGKGITLFACQYCKHCGHACRNSPRIKNRIGSAIVGSLVICMMYSNRLPW